MILIALLSLGGVGASALEVGPLREIDRLRRDLEYDIRRSCDHDRADKAEDATAKLAAAERELGKHPPDEQAALGNLEGAIGDLESAVKDKCFDVPSGVALMDDLAGFARHLAAASLQHALRHGGKRDEVHAAREHLARGDALRAAGRRGRLVAFKEASSEYRGALSKSTSAVD